MTIHDIPLWQFIGACVILVILGVGIVWFGATLRTAVNDAEEVGGWKC